MAVVLLQTDRFVEEIDDITEGEESCPASYYHYPARLSHIQLKAKSFGRTELESSLHQVHLLQFGCKLALIVYLEHDRKVPLRVYLPIINHLRLLIALYFTQLGEVGFFAAKSFPIFDVILETGHKFFHQQNVVPTEEIDGRVQSSDAFPHGQRVILS